jgi:hypothetical protein
MRKRSVRFFAHDASARLEQRQATIERSGAWAYFHLWADVTREAQQTPLKHLAHSEPLGYCHSPAFPQSGAVIQNVAR